MRDSGAIKECQNWKQHVDNIKMAKFEARVNCENIFMGNVVGEQELDWRRANIKSDICYPVSQLQS